MWGRKRINEERDLPTRLNDAYKNWKKFKRWESIYYVPLRPTESFNDTSLTQWYENITDGLFPNNTDDQQLFLVRNLLVEKDGQFFSYYPYWMVSTLQKYCYRRNIN